MKKIVLFTTVAFIFFSSSYAQKTELRVSLDSGLSSFSGKSAEPSSFILLSETVGYGYTNNPYGSKNALSYGVSLNLKRITKVNFIYGVGVGYEDLRSKTSLTDVFKYEEDVIVPVSGETFMDIKSININPFAGYRFNADKLPIDLVAGFDFANILNAKEKGDATDTNGNKYTTSRDRETINTDIRARLQISTDYKKFGVYLGYSFGIKNYKEGYVGGTNEVYSKILRFGITYQVL